MDPLFSSRGSLADPAPTPRAAITIALGALLPAVDDFDGQETTLAALKLLALLFCGTSGATI
jgi:hypothetical protein